LKYFKRRELSSLAVIVLIGRKRSFKKVPLF